MLHRMVSLKVALLLATTAISCANGGLLDIFDTTSDYNLIQSLNIVFGQTRNNIGLLLTGEDTTPLDKAITFWCASSDAPKLQQILLDDPQVATKLNMSKPISFLTHGWLDNSTRVWFQSTLRDMMQFADTNVCGVNWSRLAQYDYGVAALRHVPIVANYLTKFISFLLKSGMTLDRITLVGHSMGAQISGQVGHAFNGQIGQIFGLDPAGPMFTMPQDRGLQYRLDKGDAKYVQMIITSRGTIGVGDGDGHENFFPNGGFAPQPNCLVPLFSSAEFYDQIMCSHLHATTLFRLSLNPYNVYNSRWCLNWVSFTLQFCHLNSGNKLGPRSFRSEGDYYLQTGVFAPYVV